MAKIKEFDPTKPMLEQMKGAVEPHKSLSPEDQERLSQAQSFMQQKKKKEQAAKQEELAKIIGNGVHESPADAFVQDDNKNHEILLNDGRTIILGPPQVPFVVVASDIFENAQDLSQSKLAARARLARIMQYVRSIDNKDMGIALTSWDEIVRVSTQLGDQGCNAVMEAYNQFWPEENSSFWQEVKKNAPISTSVA